MVRIPSSVAVSALVVTFGSADAGPMDPAGGSPRAIGRAGMSAVADDGGGALQINPAGIARRSAWRVQLGVGFVDDATAWTADDAPVSRDQGGSSVLPLLAVVGAFGEWNVGAAITTNGVTDRALRDPADVSAANITDGKRAFEYRYAGIAGGARRDSLTLGVARRVGDSIAIGVSTGLSRISAHETRRMWVGFESTKAVGDPSGDVQLSLDGDAIVPHAVLGTLIAPVDTPMELGFSVGWVKRPVLDGTLESTFLDSAAPTVRSSSPSASLILRQPIAVHAGARYVGERFSLEVGGDLWFASEEAREVAWALDGVRVRDTTSGVETELDGVPSRYSLRSHGAVRASADVEIISGFLWATAGYAFATGATTEARLSPTFGDLGGHTVALGVEGTVGGVTYTIGWSRTMAVARSSDSELRLDNPFGAGDAIVPGGRYDGSSDQLGVLLDLEIAAP